MFLLKGFLRKKTTKNYFIVFCILFFILVSLLSIKNYFIELNNKNYGDSYIFITDTLDKYNQIQNNSDFSSVNIGISIADELDTYILIGSKQVNDDDIIVPKQYKDLISSTIEIFNISFKVIDVYESTNNFVFLISETIAEKLLKEIDEVTYIVDLKNWTYYDRIINDLEEEYENVFSFLNNSQDGNYNTIIIAFDIFIIITIIISIIVLLVSCFNIIEDEKKNNILYHYIGFSKLRILLLLSFKIFFLLIISIFINFVIYQLLSILY